MEAVFRIVGRKELAAGLGRGRGGTRQTMVFRTPYLEKTKTRRRMEGDDKSQEQLGDAIAKNLPRAVPTSRPRQTIHERRNHMKVSIGKPPYRKAGQRYYKKGIWWDKKGHFTKESLVEQNGLSASYVEREGDS